MLEIKTWRDPYDAGFSPTRPKKITINEGLTILVGCNGSGKTTLLNNIKEECRIHDIPVYMYDNLVNLGLYKTKRAFRCGDIESVCMLMQTSEGENNKVTLQCLLDHCDSFLKTGFMETKDGKMEKLLKNVNIDTYSHSNKRVLLLDSLDSGLSLDSITDIKLLLEAVQMDAKELGIELYLIASTNEYELTRDESCFDVNRGVYITFNNYEEYKSFVLKSRQKKEKRIEKQKKWYTKKLEKKRGGNYYKKF